MNMNSINKKTMAKRNVKYAALSSGTVSSVWYDEDHAAKSAQKRTNRIILQREKPQVKVQPHYDA